MSVKDLAVTACFAVIVASYASAQTPGGDEGTCTAQNRKCTALCRAVADAAAKQCNSDCAKRQQSCLNTGVYEWDHQPPVTKLIRR